MKNTSDVTDIVTGEVVTQLQPGDRIVRAASINMLRRNNVLVTNPDTVKQFFKGNTQEIILIMHEIDVYEKAFLFSVAPYVNFNDCCLKYHNGIDITTNDLVIISGLSRSKLFEVTESLLKKDIIYKGINSKNRQYYVNPWLFCKGNRLDKVLKNMFKNYKIRTLGGMRWENLKD